MESFSQLARCPFFVSASRNAKLGITLTCENPYEKMGFDMLTQLRFLRAADREDYFQIFCADRYYACPYFCYLAKSKEREDRIRNEKKMEKRFKKRDR